MKKILLLFAMCSSLGAWAQDPNTYGSGDNMITLNAEGSTLTITGKGNIGDITAPITTTYFASPAVGNVFTSDAGAAVTTTLVYNPANKYYTASRDYTQVFEGGMPNTTGSYVSNITTTKSWIESKLTADNVYLYSVTDAGEKLGWTTNSGYIYPVDQNTRTTGTWIDTKVNGKYIYKIMNDNGQVKIIDGLVTGSTYENMNPVKFNDQDYIPYVVSNSQLTGWSNHALDQLETEGIVILSNSNISEYANLTTEIKVKGESVVGQTMETWQKTQLAKMNGAYSDNYAYIIVNSTHNIDEWIDITSDDFTFITESNLESYIKNIKNLNISGGRITDGNINGALTTFEYDSKSLVYYVITSEAKANGTLIPIGDPCMRVFTVDEINEYINSTTTFKCTSDKLYVSKDAGENKSLLANGNTYTYEAGDLYYVAGDATYHEIEDNATYFAAHTSYLNNDTQYEDVWPMLVGKINAAGYTTLIINSEDDSQLALISQAVTSPLVHLTTVETLDLSNVVIDELKSRKSGSGINPDGTFVWTPGSTTDYGANNSVKTLMLPFIKNTTTSTDGKEHRHVPAYLCAAFNKLNSIEGGAFTHETYIKMPGNATCIEENAFEQLYLSQVEFNEGLRMIGKNAFSYFHGNELVMPSTIEYIGEGAFGQGYLHDVFFTGEVAPIVEMDAFGSKAYVNNDDYKRPSSEQNKSYWDAHEKDDPLRYAVDRSHYINGDYMMAMLHLPNNLTPAQRAAYTDITRDFHVFDLKYDVSTQKKEFYTVINSSPLKSAESLYIVTPSTQFPADATHSIYWNGTEESTSITSKGGFSVSTPNLFSVPQYDSYAEWENASAHYDKIVGKQYTWPNQMDYCRSYAVATNNLLWDGKSTIADGIGSSYSTRSYDINCDGDVEDEGETKWENGSEYIGLHQFVLVTMDVNPNTTTDEWKFDFDGANWWTLCVPVNMTVAEVRNAFGEETQVCKFTNVTRKADDKIKFYFTNEQCLGKDKTAIAVEANYPYMIRPSKAKDATYKFTLPNYTLSPAQIPTAVPITVTDGKNGKSYTYTYIGQYNTNQNSTSDADKYLYMPQYSYYLGAEPSNPTYHKLYIQTGTTGKWKPYTCVILPSDGADDYATFFDPERNASNEAKGVAGTLGLDDFEGFESATTSISNYEVICGSDAAPVYNLNGQKVDSDNLRKGIYIKNGVKFIVK